MNVKVCKILKLLSLQYCWPAVPVRPSSSSMQQPTQGATQPAPPQSITFPNGTTFGGASGRQASELAQIMVEANNNNLQEYQQLRSGEQQLQGTETKNLQTSQQALQMIEQLSQQQGTGEITLFFPGSGRTQTGLAPVYAAYYLPRLSLAREPGGAECSSC